MFLNEGDGTFREFSKESGLQDVQAGFFAFADVDEDGDQDLFAGLDIRLNGHSSAIYLNDGDGRFERLEKSGVESLTFAACATFADFDGDARLDLFVGRGGTSRAVPDALLRGRGDGTFELSRRALNDPPVQPSNGAITADYDQDGDLDIFVSTYGVSVAGGHNHLWENDGKGQFVNVAMERGFAALQTGNTFLESTGYGKTLQPGLPWIGSNGFGIDCGDVDSDGDLDILLSTISHPDESHTRRWSDPSQLLLNEKSPTGIRFENVWVSRKLPFNEGDVDAALVDFDNDGRLDISLSRERKYERRYEHPEQKSWFGLLRQLEDGTFESVGLKSGINDPEETMKRMKGAQNHAWSDIDLDGDLDLLVGGRDQGGGRPNFLFRNLTKGHSFIAFRIVGDGKNVTRDAFGTRLTLKAAGRTSLREKKSARGMYNSEDTRVQHFGLGKARRVDSLHVRWPDGRVVKIDGGRLASGKVYSLRYPDLLE